MTPVTEVELNDRQAEILRLVGDGRTVPEIAAKLGMNPRTVTWNVKNLRWKFGAAHKRDLIPVARARFG